MHARKSIHWTMWMIILLTGDCGFDLWPESPSCLSFQPLQVSCCLHVTVCVCVCVCACVWRWNCMTTMYFYTSLIVWAGPPIMVSISPILIHLWTMRCSTKHSFQEMMWYEEFNSVSIFVLVCVCVCVCACVCVCMCAFLTLHSVELCGNGPSR